MFYKIVIKSLVTFRFFLYFLSAHKSIVNKTNLRGGGEACLGGEDMVEGGCREGMGQRVQQAEGRFASSAKLATIIDTHRH